LNRLIEKGNEAKRRYMQKFISRELEIVPEEFVDGYTEGYSENYIRLYVEGEMDKEPTHVFIDGFFKDGLSAKKIKTYKEN
jgi:hypothetical protein